MQNRVQGLIISLYIPWIAAVALQSYPIASYWIAWLGSFFIFFQTWFSPSRFILPDRAGYNQIMRPLFLQQAIFAGFMCCTSIFYWLNALGYRYLDKVYEIDYNLVYNDLASIAECQRHSLLAHAALVTGILLKQKRHLFNRPIYGFKGNPDGDSWIIKICIISLILSLVMERLPGLFQFSIGLYNVAVFSGAVLFVKGIRTTSIKLLVFGGSVFVVNVINSTLTGYKEHILVNFIILTCLLYPHYKKLVIGISLPGFLILFYVLPTYANVVRGEAWFGETSSEDARSIAIESIISSDNGLIEDTNWSFLTSRLSEINMFTDFVKSTPENVSFYGFEIVENSLMVIIPRALWPAKPITEALAMERVYAAGVVETESNVSAKTRPVVDGYLSAGALGVFIYIFFIGYISQWLNNMAENYLGGYTTGSVVFFNGFFQLLWRGDTMEFLINSVFWSFISMFILFTILKSFNYIKKLE